MTEDIFGIGEVLEDLEKWLEDANIPGFLGDLRDDLVEALKDTGIEVMSLVAQGVIKQDEIIPAIKRRLLPKWGRALNDAWAGTPWYIQLLKPFIMPPVMRTLRKLLKKI